MNNDPAPSFAARQPLPSQPHHRDFDDDDSPNASTSAHHEHIGAPSRTDDGNDDAGQSSAAAAAAAAVTEAAASRSSRKQKRREGMAKKLQFMSHLQKSLDTVVFSYICALYYMECSFARLLLRIIPHYIFISPKDSLLLLPAHRPHVFAILIPNLICIVLHLLLSLPRANEATRGYMHGGVIIDFIGQKPPTSRLGLLFLDLVILGVQCLMLAVHQEREKLRKAVLPALRNAAAAGGGPAGQATAAGGGVGTAAAAPVPDSTQDHDAEERGVLRDEAYAADNDDGAERQPLSEESHHHSHREYGIGPEIQERMGSGYLPASAGVDMVDIMRSGNAVLADFHVVHAVRSVGNDYQSAAAYSLQSLGYTAALAAAMAAERRARLGDQRGQ
ncbi:hypothetical protein B0T22DRAFT_52668 [Podospora appendiculata]|uniref:DUF1746 domain-containing protein n=1 Tax=Podospora appendiculata TaxID=314037 RepID=A0AAE0XI25_9PEZI|nr:hypothetical protein B0T22DRAFT_52668 [Podospora appendiculata]